MYWVMLSERINDEDISLSGVPFLIEELNLEFDQGKLIKNQYPLIEYILKGDEVFENQNDNIVASGFNGLLSNKLVSQTLHGIGADNIQLFPVLLKGVDSEQNVENYDLINIIGRPCPKICVITYH